jgi:hypothetical protein
LSLSFEQQVILLWDNYTVKIIQNIHREGGGVQRLSLTENKSDPVRILQGTNQILGNYYKLMLKTYQSPDANISNTTILDILDNTAVRELRNINFNYEKTYSDEEIVDKLNQSIQFSLLKASIKHLIIYMYLPWKVMNYKKIMTVYYPDSDLAKYYDETVNDTDKTKVKQFIETDPAAQGIVDRYPLLRVNYIDEIKLMDEYASSIKTEEQKQILDKYIAFSVIKFNDAFDNQNKAYIDSVTTTTSTTTTTTTTTTTPVTSATPSTPSAQQKQKAHNIYMTYFNTYFDTLYGDVINQVLMKLNPNKSQLFIFDTKFMRDVIDEVMEINNTFKLLDPTNRFLIVESILILLKNRNNDFLENSL